MSITEGELNSIRDEQLKFMTQKAMIFRPQFDGESFVEGTNPLYKDIDFRADPGFGRWGIVADRFATITPWVLTFPWDTDVQVNDRVVSPSAESYHVRAVQDGDKSLGTAIRVLTDRIT